MDLLFRLDCILKLFHQRGFPLLDLARLMFGEYVDPPNEAEEEEWDLENPVVVLEGGSYADGDLCTQYWSECLYMPYRRWDFRFFVGGDST